MNSLWRGKRHIEHARAVPRILIRTVSDLRPFAAGDLCMLREKRDQSARPIFTRPLKPGGTIKSHKGVISHDDIIGRRVRDVVRTLPLRSGRDSSEFRLHEVKLDEYVRMTSRLVTPIYPGDASLIVDLLELHPDVFDLGCEGEPKLEILEAGTGHGSLTLYLSRAVHTVNPPRPAENSDVVEWKTKRRAIVHTIDSASKFSSFAEDVVRGFKHGLYFHNIDFYVNDVAIWARSALADRRGEPFLSHAILDLPNADLKLNDVARALRVDGTLIVFNPSITQILQCFRKIKDEGVPLQLEKVIELGMNGGSEGREWDVRPVKLRKRPTISRPATDALGGDVFEASSSEDLSQENDQAGGWSIVCRPKVGDRIVGGGFVGVWKKQRDSGSQSSSTCK